MFRLLAVLVFTASSALAQTKKSIDKLTAIAPALHSCFHPAAAGSEITVMFTFNRKGEVFGKPRITHTTLAGDEEARKAFVAAALKALADCTPLNFSDALGGGVAGRPFFMRFTVRPAETRT